MRLTMKTVHRMLGETFTPSLLAIINVGLAAGYKFDDDDVCINEVLRGQVLDYLQGEASQTGHPFKSGITFSTSARQYMSIPLGPDYLTAAMAFLDNPNAENLQADVNAFQNLLGHVGRIRKLL